MSKRVLHCWKDEEEYFDETYGFGSDEWAAAFNRGGGTCMLDAGHDGAHEFTPDDQFTITFAPPEVTHE